MSIPAVLISHYSSILIFVMNRSNSIIVFISSILNHQCQKKGIILIGLMSLSLIEVFAIVSGIRKVIDLFLFLDHLNVN
jgi:hypothetical protein